jgi:hypothetical protein
MKTFVWISICAVTMLHAQIRVTGSQLLPVPPVERWSAPQFSPSGQEVYLTNQDYNGIWQYSLEKKLLKQITADPQSGFDFSISEDGSKISYRTTVVQGDHRSRVQQTVEVSVVTGTRIVWHTGNSVSMPRYSKNDIIVPETFTKGLLNPEKLNRPAVVLGTMDGKIALMQQWSKKEIDPAGSGGYLWPAVSPDGQRIAAVSIERGAFVSALDGSEFIGLGKCNAPRWTRSGKWIIGMDDTDDGHRITGSDIVAVSADGTRRLKLTETSSEHEMYPALSATADMFIVTTLSGNVILYTYEEGE